MKFYSYRWRLWHWTVTKLIQLAMRTPFSHLYHGDGSLYMERYWLVPFTNLAEEGCWIAKWWREPFVWLCQRFDIAMRIHVICTSDQDRALHDHPWNYISVVLRGHYTEQLPMFNDRPCFFDHYTEESTFSHYRDEGSVVFRRATDRHRISHATYACTTLFITGPKRQWWGFYIPSGKVYHRDFDSVHNAISVGKATARAE